jgi:hypothetical protein
LKNLFLTTPRTKRRWEVPTSQLTRLANFVGQHGLRRSISSGF